jgi:hypothetical protein
MTSEPISNRLTRAPAFTLATALAWLGHDCVGGCPPELTGASASVWLLGSGRVGQGTGADVLVVVGFGDCGLTPTVVDRLLLEVNRCALPDHIRVRERVKTDQVR